MSNKYAVGDIVKIKNNLDDISNLSDPQKDYAGKEVTLKYEQSDTRWAVDPNQSNGYIIEESMIDYIVKRADCKYKLGDKVVPRKIKENERKEEQAFAVEMSNFEYLTISEILNRNCFIPYTYKVKEKPDNNERYWSYSDWMFEGLYNEKEESTALSKEVLDIVNNFADPTPEYIEVAKEILKDRCSNISCRLCFASNYNNKNNHSGACGKQNLFKQAVEEYIRRWEIMNSTKKESKSKIHYTDIQYPCVITDINADKERIEHCKKIAKDMYIYANLGVYSIKINKNNKIDTWCGSHTCYSKTDDHHFYSYNDIDWREKTNDDRTKEIDIKKKLIYCHENQITVKYEGKPCTIVKLVIDKSFTIQLKDSEYNMMEIKGTMENITLEDFDFPPIFDFEVEKICIHARPVPLKHKWNVENSSDPEYLFSNRRKHLPKYHHTTKKKVEKKRLDTTAQAIGTKRRKQRKNKSKLASYQQTVLNTISSTGIPKGYMLADGYQGLSRVGSLGNFSFYATSDAILPEHRHKGN